jgi:hypothetical protein
MRMTMTAQLQYKTKEIDEYLVHTYIPNYYFGVFDLLYGDMVIRNRYWSSKERLYV